MAILPKGPMDIATKRQLLEAGKGIPRYLFRVWRNVEPPSGGFIGLNTVEAITPRAFFSLKSKPNKVIYDLSRQELEAMCWNHLTGVHGYTEFSSWASSLAVALHFVRRAQAEDHFISIIDTNEFANPIFHVPSLAPILGMSHWDHEYLAYGVITGTSHRAVPLQALLNIGITLPQTSIRTIPGTEPGRIVVISTTELENAQLVAQLYGEKFGAAVMIAILCLKKRDRFLWRDGTHGVAEIINENLLQAGFEVPQDLCADVSILTDEVYTIDFGEVEQMIRMLRAIVDLRYGRGAREKRPTSKALERE